MPRSPRPVVITSLPRRRVRRLTLVLVVAIAFGLAAAGAYAWCSWSRRSDDEALRAAADTLAKDWAAGHLADVDWAAPQPGTATVVPAEAAAAITSGLTPANTDHRPTSVVVRSVRRGSNGRPATATLSVTWTLDAREWTYDTRAGLVRPRKPWQVIWSQTLIHPSLLPGEVLHAARTPATRADILGAGGQVIVTSRPVALIGFEPAEAADRQAAARALAKVVGVDPDELARRASAVKNKAVLDVITLRQAAYAQLERRLAGLVGVVVTQSRLPLAPTAGFARALLGSVGPATAEIVASTKGRVSPGTLTGLSGLQRTYDERLSGTPGLEVTAVAAADAAGVQSSTDQSSTDQSGRSAGSGATRSSPRVVYLVPAKNGPPLRLTVDVRTQLAAEAALATATKPAALVAMKASTGEVMAVANGGPGAAGFDRALVGRYPPGSTFKTVSTYALLKGGLNPDESVACPPAATVNGKTFTNFENEHFGGQPFRTDFALSCNTAFVGLSSKLSQPNLVATALALGVGAQPALGTPAFTGSIPAAAGDVVEHAADMIGQGKVLASPLTMATVSAAVADGTPHRPRLVIDPAQREAGTALSPLDPTAVKELRSLMREVVTSGTGIAVRSAPGGPVSAKTGTAEYGTAVPPRTHAWFIGFQGDVAFAVLVEDGGTGGSVAAPLAGSFLSHLAAG